MPLVNYHNPQNIAKIIITICRFQAGFSGIPWFKILFGLLMDPVVMPGENSGKAYKAMEILVAFLEAKSMSCYGCMMD